VYLDDVNVFGRTKEELREASDAIERKLERKRGTEPSEDHFLWGIIRVPVDWPLSRNKTELQVFLGMANWHRGFTRRLALYGMTEEENGR
jgi:hypothetical protein